FSRGLVETPSQPRQAVRPQGASRARRLSGVPAYRACAAASSSVRNSTGIDRTVGPPKSRSPTALKPLQEFYRPAASDIGTASVANGTLRGALTTTTIPLSLNPGSQPSDCALCATHNPMPGLALSHYRGQYW